MRLRHAETMLLVAVCLFAEARPAAAAKVYLLNNYPSQQNGGELSGQITVTDTAANDGLLTSGEIVAWKFTAINSTLPTPGSTTVDSTTAADPNLILIGKVLISSNQISLPAIASGSNVLSLSAGPVDTTNDGLLFWTRVSNTGQYSAQDGPTTYWNAVGARLTLGGTDPWVIATALPEPGSLTLLGLGVMGMLRFRRHKA